jgi:hypothetical protein
VFFDAWLNDWRQHEAFFQGTLSNEQRREILDDLFIDDERLRNVLDGWQCPQWDLLIIDERERYQYCCLPNNHPSYSLGAVDDRITRRLLNRGYAGAVHQFGVYVAIYQKQRRIL